MNRHSPLALLPFVVAPVFAFLEPLGEDVALATVRRPDPPAVVTAEVPLVVCLPSAKDRQGQLAQGDRECLIDTTLGLRPVDAARLDDDLAVSEVLLNRLVGQVQVFPPHRTRVGRSKTREEDEPPQVAADGILDLVGAVRPSG
ncbi:MAG: hypothetical protein AAGI37_04820 [Planctomycetota bacterium]